ncbi:MAG: hypothetical protein OEW39_00870 [Deltaproteobacteria bacterium]|nr:hypothetical protein [Deltaproteobacteria bacterium]
MADSLNPSVYGYYAALINHPAYYHLYGLYADYPLNNAFFLPLEAQQELETRLREIQPLLWNFRPYRKSPALRLFTERATLARFSPELVDEAWRQLRQVIEQLGPPPHWPHASPRPTPEEASERRPLRTAGPSDPAEGKPGQGVPGTEVRPSAKRTWPRSPVNYDQEA